MVIPQKTDPTLRVSFVLGNPTADAFSSTLGGDPGWIRTIDLPLRRRPLYPLSYGAMPPLVPQKGTKGNG
jgi:hypothetical protein